MSHKIIYITLGILAVITIALFIGGYWYLQKGALPVTPEEITVDSFPFGTGSTPREITPRTGETAEREAVARPQEQSASGELLREISPKEIPGAVISTKNNKPAVRYMERQTGHVYEVEDLKASPKRISNTTTPGIQKAVFGERGESVVFQYLDATDVKKTVTGKIAATSTSTGLLGSVFLNNIRDLVVSPDKKNVFYVLRGADGAIGTTAKLDGGGRKQVFTSPVTEWLSQWVDTNTITLITKPASSAPGFLYTLNLTNSSFNKVLGEIAGLTALMSPDKKQTLFSASSKNEFDTFLYNVQNRVAALFAITTFPEKCVWSNDAVTLYCGAPQDIESGTYPDMWYQGRVSFNDSIWKINTETGIIDVLINPEESAREPIDVINPMLDENETVLIFTNKKNSTLWSLQL